VYTPSIKDTSKKYRERERERPSSSASSSSPSSPSLSEKEYTEASEIHPIWVKRDQRKREVEESITRGICLCLVL